MSKSSKGAIVINENNRLVLRQLDNTSHKNRQCLKRQAQADSVLGKNANTIPQLPVFLVKRLELVRWLCTKDVDLAVVGSTSVHWKPVFEVLGGMIPRLYLVNSRHAKNVPGRKTDVKDSGWLAELAWCGLLKSSFIPPKDLREIRFLTRYLMKLSG